MHRAALAVAALSAACAIAACGVRAPAPVDTAAIVARRGPEEARRDLVAAVLAEPRDVGARLALAELDDRIGRPSEALDELETVVTLGGPLGVRWHDADRARLARLLLERGRARGARGSTGALADLQRARQLGAAVTAHDLAVARAAVATTALRHIDPGERAKGRAALAELSLAGDAEPAWAGARRTATPAQHGAFGAWLWSIGARREAYEQLAAWHAASAPRDPALEAAYLRALAWWSPVWLGQAPLPPAGELTGPERCLFPVADCPPLDESAFAAAPAAAQPGAPAPMPSDLAHARALAAVRYAHARFAGASDEARLLPIASAYDRARDTVDRLGRDLVAQSVDAAAGSATLGALFDALGDPARARGAWQAAFDRSPEPAFARGLAEAAARTRDGAAALVFGTQAAAALGDPASVWASIAAALEGAGQHVDALTAAGSAIDLAGPDVLPRALDVAIAASVALERIDQVATLRSQRARFAESSSAEARVALATYRTLPTAGTIARLWVVSRAQPRDLEVRIALATALDADDPRRTTIVAELAAFASDPDPARALAAVSAIPR